VLGDTSSSANTRNICMSALNKGSSSDPGTWSINSHTHVRTGGIQYIYTENCNRCYLLILTLLAWLSLGGAKVLSSSIYSRG
jgi:hypothetical protein